MNKTGYFYKLFIRLAALACSTVLLSGCGFFGAGIDPAPPQYNSPHGIVKTACSQMGKKYCPGGSSPQKGFDCSGLVWWSYKQHGIKVPRISTDQAKTGKKVPRKQIKAGDIVIFKIPNTPRGLHTGIYAGAGSFIHSPSSGKKVCMEKLDSYWTNRLISIRRVIY